MKAIELMQKLGELVVAHGDIEVVLDVIEESVISKRYIRGVYHEAQEVPNYQDMHFIAISEWK